MWTMPDKVLQVVAGLLAFCAVGGFVLGFAGAPQRGRLPGEAVAGGASPMAATEARPLNSDELAPPKPPEPEPEAEKAEDKPDESLIPAEKTPPLKLPPAEQAPAPDPVGAIIDAAPPPPEDPPF